MGNGGGRTWAQGDYHAAFWFAAEAHRAADQLFPGTDLPYICHPVMVATEVLVALREEPGKDEVLAVQCALLHDTIEDTDVTRALLLSRFGQPVADGVSALSKDPSAAGDRTDGGSRKAAMMRDSLARIRAQPREIWMVKLADRIANLEEPPHYWDTGKRAVYREEAGLIHRTLKDASQYLARRLERRIARYGDFITRGG